MKWQWRIEVKTGDPSPHQEWLELYGNGGHRYRYVEREEAEVVLARLKQIQPHAEFRVAPMS